MKYIKYKEFQKLIEAEYERRDLEFKSPFKWKKRSAIDLIQGMVIKSIICISNLRFGGTLIIGIKQKGKHFEATGLTKSQFNSFKDFDQIKGQVDSFVYSNTNYEMEWTKNEKGKYFVIFRISTFEDYPLITKKDLIVNSSTIISKDTIYSRSKKSPYSSDKASVSELKEIIDNTVDKNIKLLESRGLVPPTGPSDKDLFKEQKKDLFT